MKKISIKKIVSAIGENLSLGEEYIEKLTKDIEKDGYGEEITVADWIKKQGRFYRLIFYTPIIVSILIFLFRIGFSGSLFGLDDVNYNKSLKLLIYTIQIIFIFMVLMYLSFPKKKKGDQINIQNKIFKRVFLSLKTFFKYWSILWVSWFIFYLIWTIKSFAFHYGFVDVNELVSTYPDLFINAIQDAVNNFSSAIFFCMYFELRNLTQEDNQIRKANPLMASFMVVLSIFLIELVLLFVFQENSDIKDYFGIIGGLGAGVCMGLFFSRLDSTLLNLPKGIITYLILYAVMQIGYIYFDDSGPILPIAFILIAFVGKTLLFIVVHYLYDTKRLFYYMFRMYYLLIEEQNSHYRQVFLDIYNELDINLITNEAKK